MLKSILLWAAANTAGVLAIDNLRIPQVDHDVKSMVNEYQHYVKYAGPTGAEFAPFAVA